MSRVHDLQSRPSAETPWGPRTEPCFTQQKDRNKVSHQTRIPLSPDRPMRIRRYSLSTQPHSTQQHDQLWAPESISFSQDPLTVRQYDPVGSGGRSVVTTLRGSVTINPHIKRRRAVTPDLALKAHYQTSAHRHTPRPRFKGTLSGSQSSA